MAVKDDFFRAIRVPEREGSSTAGLFFPVAVLEMDVDCERSVSAMAGTAFMVVVVVGVGASLTLLDHRATVCLLVSG